MMDIQEEDKGMYAERVIRGTGLEALIYRRGLWPLDTLVIHIHQFSFRFYVLHKLEEKK